MALLFALLTVALAAPRPNPHANRPKRTLNFFRSLLRGKRPNVFDKPVPVYHKRAPAFRLPFIAPEPVFGGFKPVKTAPVEEATAPIEEAPAEPAAPVEAEAPALAALDLRTAGV